MIEKQGIFVTLLLCFYIPILHSQDTSLSDRIELLRKEKLEAKYWGGGDCFINGMLDIRTIEDSIHGFSIVVPSDHSLKIYQKNHFQVMRFHPVKANSSSNIVMEIWTNFDSSLDVKDAFDQDLKTLLVNKRGFRIGKQEIGDIPSYWIESFDRKPADGYYWEVSFYTRNPISNSIVIIRQKSKKKELYRQEFCIHGVMVRQLRWL